MDTNELVTFAEAEQAAEQTKAGLWRCSGKAGAELARQHEERAERFATIASRLREGMWREAQS